MRQYYDVEIDPTGHYFDSEYVYNTTHHWKTCHCGSESEKNNHSFSEWEVIKEPTVELEGLMKRYCGCGYEETESIEKLVKTGCYGTLNQSLFAVILLSSFVLYLYKRKKIN